MEVQRQLRAGIIQRLRTLRDVDLAVHCGLIPAAPVVAGQRPRDRSHQPFGHIISAAIAKAAERIGAVTPSQKGWRHVRFAQQWKPGNADRAGQIERPGQHCASRLGGIGDDRRRLHLPQDGRRGAQKPVADRRGRPDHTPQTAKAGRRFQRGVVIAQRRRPTVH